MPLPRILCEIQEYFTSQEQFNSLSNHSDGRVNSCLDEELICKSLFASSFASKIKTNSTNRAWYDILVFDDEWGKWLPVNIKSTSTKTKDNVGNLSICVQCFTDYQLEFDKNYNNGFLSEIFIEKVRNQEFNTEPTKDYYFIVFNKNEPSDVIVNSVLGLTTFYRNIDNLPFQVCWNENREYNFTGIDSQLTKFQSMYRDTELSWKEKLLYFLRYGEKNSVKLRKKDFGQYFTTHELLKNKVVEFIHNEPKHVLEPSVGRGDLVNAVLEKYPNVEFDMFEIDDSISFIIPNSEKVVIADFLQTEISTSYSTIIGNPPFVKKKGQENLFISFIHKCATLLNNNGELIFIVPSLFFKMTSSQKCINYMMKNGYFTHIFHPNNEKLFQHASIDVVVFRYVKSVEKRDWLLWNDKKVFFTNSNGILNFTQYPISENFTTISDLFSVHVGLVSGKEDVFRNDVLSNFEMIVGENKRQKYILIDKFPSENKEINQYLEQHKPDLLNRKIRKFNESNWFEWGALRNLKLVRKNMGQECIYLYTKTRHENVAFLGTVDYFNGNLLLLLPKRELNLKHIVDYLNSSEFKFNYTYSGRFEISHRSIQEAFIHNI